MTLMRIHAVAGEEDRVVGSDHGQHIEGRVGQELRPCGVVGRVQREQPVAIVHVAQEHHPLAVRMPGGGKGRVHAALTLAVPDLGQLGRRHINREQFSVNGGVGCRVHQEHAIWRPAEVDHLVGVGVGEIEVADITALNIEQPHLADLVRVARVTATHAVGIGFFGEVVREGHLTHLTTVDNMNRDRLAVRRPRIYRAAPDARPDLTLRPAVPTRRQ